MREKERGGKKERGERERKKDEKEREIERQALLQLALCARGNEDDIFERTIHISKLFRLSTQLNGGKKKRIKREKEKKRRKEDLIAEEMKERRRSPFFVRIVCFKRKHCDDIQATNERRRIFVWLLSVRT